MFKDYARSQVNACYDILKFSLNAVLKENRPADKAISYYFKNHRKYGSRDRRIMYDVVFSVFRWYGWLKEIIPSCAYCPDFLALNSKNLAKMAFAAGILDGTIDESIMEYWKSELHIPDGLYPSDKNSPNENLGLKVLTFFGLNNKLSYSSLVPEWTYNKIKKILCDENELIRWYQARPPIWIRIQTIDTKKLFKEFKKHVILYSSSKAIKNALCIKNARVDLYSLDSFKAGLFEIQDIASQVIGLVSGARQKERWWDCCAGAGGKSLQLSNLMENKGRIVSSDIREYKLEELKKRARRNEKSNIECKLWDGKSLRNKKTESFDGILIDAPCSCSGTWRRNPDAKWRLMPHEVEELCYIQSSILNNVSSAVKAGGTIVYATCSIFEEENELIVKDFLTSHSGFCLESFINPLDGATTNGMLRIYPWMANCDAMFVAKIRRVQ